MLTPGGEQGSGAEGENNGRLGVFANDVRLRGASFFACRASCTIALSSRFPPILVPGAPVEMDGPCNEYPLADVVL